MSAPAVVRHLLAHDSGVLAQVSASKIIVGPLKTGEALPAIRINLVSGMEELTVAMTERRMRTQRVQVTVFSKTPGNRQTLIELVRSAVPNTTGTVNSTFVDSILPAGEGPFIDDVGDTPDASIYEASRDYLVRWLPA